MGENCNFVLINCNKFNVITTQLFLYDDEIEIILQRIIVWDPKNKELYKKKTELREFHQLVDITKNFDESVSAVLKKHHNQPCSQI